MKGSLSISLSMVAFALAGCESSGLSEASPRGASEPDTARSASSAARVDGNGTAQSASWRQCPNASAPDTEVIIRTRDEARALGDAYSIVDTLIIEGDELTSLDALSCLARVDNLIVSDTALRNIRLPALETVGTALFENNEDLRVIALRRAASMSALEVVGNPALFMVQAGALEEIHGDVEIGDNDALSAVNLSALQRVEAIDVHDNPSLQRLRLGALEEAYSVSISQTGLSRALVLPELHTVTAQLWLEENPYLQDVRLGKLQTVNESLVMASGLIFHDNSSLRELQMPSLVEVNGHFSISENANLREIRVSAMEVVGKPDALCDRGCTTGWLNISDNLSLTSVSFPSLQAIARRLSIADNPALTELDGFSSLSIIRGNLEITDNERLEDIHGLFNLESVGSWAAPIGPDAGNLLIAYNERLDSEQAEELAFDVIGEDNVGGGIIIAQ